jgi:D-alanyl-D-alanine carboxypeptidase/D-alanyl-D-alanine-endopeptidase (penicillin-binding protein 4)
VLDTDDLADMAAALVAQGVRQIGGRFLVSGGGLPSVTTIDPSQPIHVGYSPAVSGLVLNYNRVHFEWKRTAGGYHITMDARACPQWQDRRCSHLTASSPLISHYQPAR